MPERDFKVEDKRHWAKADDLDPVPEVAETEAVPLQVDAAELDAIRARAEGAERRLREVQEGFLSATEEMNRTRERLERDLERKVAIRFGDLVAELLETADDLDRAIDAGRAVEAASPVVQGVSLARDRFLAALVRAGVTRFDPTGEPYDPNLAEAVGVLAVDDPARRNEVVELVRAGYLLGDRVIRPARVLVGKPVA